MQLMAGSSDVVDGISLMGEVRELKAWRRARRPVTWQAVAMPWGRPPGDRTT